MTLRLWLCVTLAALIVGAFTGWSVNGWRHDAEEKAAVADAIKRTEAAYAKRDSDFASMQTRDDAITIENAKLKQQIVDQAIALQDAVRGLSLIQQSKVPNENGQCECIDTRRSTTYRLCVNAALSGDTSAVTACEAERGHATLPGERL